MLRVLLQISQIKINVKEPVGITILIKKGDKKIECKQIHLLLNGKAIFKQNFQFYIEKENPLFHIETIIILNNIKKSAGYIQINLNQFQINLANQLQKRIQKCKDPSGKMLVQLMYMNSDYICIKGNQLISSQDLELLKISKQKLEVSRKRQQIQSQAKKLQQQYQKILTQNKQLSKKLSTLDKQQQIQQKKFKQEINFYELKTKETILNLQKQKVRMAEIVDLINEEGDPKLIDKIQEIIDVNVNELE